MSFKPWWRDESLIPRPLIEDIKDELPFINLLLEVVERVPLNHFRINEGAGAPQYHPRLMLSTVVYGFSEKVFSLRGLEKKVRFDKRFEYVAGGNVPDYSCYGRFIQNNSKAITECMVQMLLYAIEKKLLVVENVGMDGTKIKSNANINRALTVKEAQQQLKEVEEKITAWADSTSTYCMNIIEQSKMDNAELQKKVAKQGLEMGQAMDELKTLIQLKKTLEQALEQAHNDAADDAEYQYRKQVDQANLERQIGSTTHSNEQSLTNQEESQTTSGTTLNERTLLEIDPEEIARIRAKAKPPKSRLINLTDPSSRRMRVTGKTILQAHNAQAVVDLDGSHLVLGVNVVSNEIDKQLLRKNTQELDPRLGQPKKIVADKGYVHQHEIEMNELKGLECLIPLTHQNKKSPQTPFQRMMEQRFSKPENKKLYSKRQPMNEGAFAQIKENLGFRKLYRRGLKAINTEFELITAAHNILRISKLALS